MSRSYVKLDITANRTVVFDLLDELRLAWQGILNAYPEQKGHGVIDYMDGCMAVHNFHKLALDHVITEAAMDAPHAEAFLMAMRDTFSQAIETEIEKRRQRSTK